MMLGLTEHRLKEISNILDASGYAISYDDIRL